ncbi:universal stress protein [Aeromicrobium terrae]|nr:universal stress protein [Aeromicrobium terrae]
MTHTTRPVVVGLIDKQPTAVQLAVREARRLNAPLRVIHAHGDYAYASGLGGFTRMVEDLEKIGEEVLDDARSLIEQEPAQPVAVEYDLDPGSAPYALEDASRDACLLVLGADQISFLERLIRGTVTSHLVKTSSCPIIFVPEATFLRSSSGGVVVALDGDTAATGPLTFAFEQAQCRAGHLEVLHALSGRDTGIDADEDRAAIAEVVAGWRERYPDVRVTTTFSIAEPDEACRNASRRAELVVLGAPHVKAAFVMRPLATAVVRAAEGPVAVVPADYAGTRR